MSDIVMSLYIGPVAPVPVSKAVINAFVSCEVRSVTEGKSGFQLVFEVETNSPLLTVFMLASNNPIPMVRTVIAVEMNGQQNVLIDGVVTEHSINPGSAPGISRMTLNGEDLSRVLDYLDFSFMRFPAMPDFARVNLVLAKYAFLASSLKSFHPC